MSDVLEPEDDWVMPPPVNYTEMSTAELRTLIHKINDRLVEKGAPRPLISPTVTRKDAERLGQPELALDEETKDLHSRYFAIRFALDSRGVTFKDQSDE